MPPSHVICPRCTAENLGDAADCAGCGATLSSGGGGAPSAVAPGGRCPRCGAINLPRQKFCGECAAPIGVVASSSTVTAAEAERRQITVLFCDLVGSTALSQELDPEDFREVIRAYQATCAEIVARFDGHVAQFLGDGILAYFGYPSAHEDDARRAVRAGLEFIGALGALRPRGRVLHVRVGIHTGLVVVGEIGAENHRAQLAIGETPNFAFHVQELATPGTVLITEATHRLVRGFFTCEDLGERVLRRMNHAVKIHRVLNESGARGRMDAAASTGFTPYVGRTAEIDTMLSTWGDVVNGKGRAIAICGEAGIGKSRLLETLKSQLDTERNPIAECQCSPYFKNRALYPIVDLLERVVGLKGKSGSDVKLARLEASLAATGVLSPQAVPLLAALLSIPVDGRYPELQLTPERQRQRTLETLVQWLATVAKKTPMLFVLEDLHWADPSTLEFVRLVVEKEAPRSLLCVFTYRNEFAPSWQPHQNLTHLDLRPLPPEDAEIMATFVADRKTLPAEVLALLVAKTGGIPLYIEEVTKAILETGQLREMEDRYELIGPLPSGVIPATVQDSLMARLDRLGRSKPLAQLAATLGREFRYEVLRAVSHKNDQSLQSDLSRLIDAELVFQTGVPPNATYYFKHALIRDAAYGSLLRKTRQQYHREIAETLQTRFPAIADAQPDLMAIHFEGAEMPSEAVTEWQKAGVQALARAANQEALAHLSRALELLMTLPEGKERDQRELELQRNISPAYMVIKGWQAPEVGVACSRAFELCQRIGDNDRVLPVIWGLWSNHFVKGDIAPALETARYSLEVATKTDNPVFHELAHHAVGFTLFFHGDFAGARHHSDAGRAVFDLERERALVGQLQLSSMVAISAFGAGALWMLGEVDRARRQLDEMFSLVKNLAHPPTEAFARSTCSWLECFRRDADRTREHAERALALSHEHGFFLWIAVENAYLGWALAQQGDLSGGLSLMREAIGQYRAVAPTGLVLTQMYANLAETVWRNGDADEALTVIDQGVAHAANSGWHYAEPELHRLRGEILYQTGSQAGQNAERAAASLQRAIAVADRLGAKSLALRASISLAKLWGARGRGAEARALLRSAYLAVGDGVDDVDSREAARLLATLSPDGEGRAAGGPDLDSLSVQEDRAAAHQDGRPEVAPPTKQVPAGTTTPTRGLND